MWIERDFGKLENNEMRRGKNLERLMCLLTGPSPNVREMQLKEQEIDVNSRD